MTIRNNSKNSKCAIYTHETTYFTGDNDLNSSDYQRMACEALMNIKNEFVLSSKKYDDIGCNSEDLDRPTLKKLFKDIKRGLVDTVVVYDLNILSMRFSSLVKIMEFFDKHKVRLIAIGQGKDTSKPSGEDILPQMLRKLASM